MISFLTDVLVTAGKLDKVNLQDKVSDIEKEVTKLKYDVKHFLADSYIEFTSKLTRDQNLVLKTEKLQAKMKDTESRIDKVKVELSGSTKELETLLLALKESNMCLQLSDTLLTLHECIKTFKNYRKEKKYVDAAKILGRIQTVLVTPQSDASSLDIYVAIEEEYLNLYNSFLSETSNLLYDRICWTVIENDKDTGIVELCIKDELTDMQDLIRALHNIDNLWSHLHKFATTLMDFLITPIINDDCSVRVVNEKIFTVEIHGRKKTSNYKCVLYNLELLFKFLHQYFNVPVEEDRTFLKMIQPHLLDQLAESLLANCISQTIPSSAEDLKNFGPVIEAINQFHYFLVKIEFITSDQLFLPEYTKNIDKLFIEKFCQDLLSKARVIMKKDLHDSIMHVPKQPHESCEDSTQYSQLEIDRKLSNATFHLPVCQISKSAKETLDLARTVLDEACRSSDACAIQLFYTCRNLFEMYAGLVPEHHRKFLETIPQQVALFHNNCIYLAHHLLTLAHEYRHKLPEALQQFNLTFADQTLVLRDVGSECFLKHMRYQRNIIFEILKESGLSALGQTSELHPSTERALRQCIRQLELLKTVWLNVLPVNIYCKAVGCIANSMVEELIVKVISVEDIPADVATELVTLFNVVGKRAPPIFPNPKKISLHVKKWVKFLELIKVLGASLKEIEIRWGSGKGQLAKEFTAPQIKQLIRALFQNTERRSNLLASIK